MTRHTPIESLLVKSVRVYVKRDDLFADAPSPRLGKLRGLKAILRGFSESGFDLVGCWDTRVSKLGLGLAAMVHNHRGMKAIVSFPALKGEPFPESIKVAENLRAEILPIRGNHVSICYSQVRKIVERRGGVMLPFGLECQEAVHAVAEEASTLPSKVLGGSLVICSGSGVSLAGVLLGTQSRFQAIRSVSSGRSVEKIRSCLEKYVDHLPGALRLIPASVPYYQECNDYCPFPCDANYDRKAWSYLVRHIKSLPQPVLFWNIGS